MVGPHGEERRVSDASRTMRPERPKLASSSVFRRPGGFREEPEPDPIPNSAVKLLCADGTKSQGLGE